MRATIRSWPRIAVGLVVVVLIGSGCGGGGGGSTQAVTAPPLGGPGGGGAPHITGTPAVSAVVGQNYNFQPQATDPEGDRITFSIKSKPDWAQFDTATGRLWGTPQTAHVGVHESIEISASDGASASALPPFAVIVGATQTANTVTIGWTPPTENDDGTPLTDLVGFRLYYGEATQNYVGTLAIDRPNTTQHIVDNLPVGTYYFTVTAVNAAGLESVYSTEVKTTI
jgi:hypothetical protein